jgi:hypothetical protein
VNPRIAFAFSLTSAALLALALASSPARAAPGAHGPDGEHLDGKAAAAAVGGVPRVEAKSEQFELVARLVGGALTILIDRYETNEPVLGAKLDVESGPIKATAAFRAESGDYAVTDAALVAALAQPGEHALVFTLVAGNESDLLDGTLVTAGGMAAAGAGSDHGHGAGEHDHALGLPRAAWIGAGLAVLAFTGGIAWWRRQRRDATPSGATR